MANPLQPPGFTSLAWAANTSNTSYNVIGVCVDYFEPAKSRGSDYTSQIVLRDPTWIQDRGFKFRFFDGSEDNLPKIRANGDVLILRNVCTKPYNMQPLGMSNSKTTWIVLYGSSILESTRPDGSDIGFITSVRGHERPPRPTAEELRYVKQIVDMEDPSRYSLPRKSTALEVENIIKNAGGTPPRRKDKWQLIKDLSVQSTAGKYNFADLFGEVRKSWYNDYGRLELSLTDYTTNKLLYNYVEEAVARDGDAYNHIGSTHEHWPGPWGRMTIGVVLFDAHAVFAKSQVKPGMFVLIRNCQIKLDPRGSKLEAVCRGDRDDVSKVNVSIFKPRQAESDQRFKDLLKRRVEYEKYAKAKGMRFGFGSSDDQNSGKRLYEAISTGSGNDGSAENTVEDQVNPKKESRAAKKKRRRAAKQNAGATAAASTIDVENTSANTMLGGVNQYVRCNNIAVPPKSISDILDPATLSRKTPAGNQYSLPFQNCSYKSRVRVVDYYPNDLVDFAVPYRVSDPNSDDDLSNPTNTQDHHDNFRDIPSSLTYASAQSNASTVRWEWCFFLIVEDAIAHAIRPPEDAASSHGRTQMALLVADQDAEYLLNAEASDLRARPQELAKLREKLFVLWGDLQERKEEAAVAADTRGTERISVEDDHSGDIGIKDNKMVANPAATVATTMTTTALVKAQSRPFECFIKEYGVPSRDPQNTSKYKFRNGDYNVLRHNDKHDHGHYLRMFRLFGTTI